MSAVSEALVAAATAPEVIGRYALFDELAAGGMATVHLGRLLGPVGFGRTVAVKRLHAHFLKDPEFITMFMDEARIVARIRHPNVVPMVDVVQNDKGLFLIMEYVHGESFSRLIRTMKKNGELAPPRVIAAIIHGVLMGLHAAHETKSEGGQLLGVVHRDVSPQNIIVGADGVARVLDFGVAKAAGRAQITREGQIKGKLAYVAPEQIRGQVDRRTDIFAATVVLWEALTARRLHDGAKDVDIVTRVVQGNFDKPSQYVPSLSPAVDALVLKGLAVDPKQRYATARELAVDLERTIGLATATEVSDWVESIAHDVLVARANLANGMELASRDLMPVDSHPPPSAAHGIDARIGGGDFGGPPASDGMLAAIPIAVDLDPPTPGPNEVPSSSAVFAHTHPSSVTGPHQPAQPPRSAMPWILAIGLALLLAMTGLALGTYSLVKRFQGPSRGPAAAGRAPSTNATSPAQAPLAPPTEASASSSPSAPAATAASSGPSASGTTSAPSASPASSSALPAKPEKAEKPTRPGGFVARPPPPPPQPKGPKPSCDPPWTIDEQGHKHYKQECLD